MQNPFYMVFLEGGNSPKFQHYSLSDAENEAKRLSVAHGKKAVILASIKSVEEKRFEIKDLRPTEDLPF